MIHFVYNMYYISANASKTIYNPTGRREASYKDLKNFSFSRTLLAKILYEPPSTSRVLDKVMFWKILRYI